MSKKPALSDALHKASGKKEAVVAVQETQPEAASRSETPSPQPPSRRGKKAIAGHFDPAVARQLKQMALDRDATVQALLEEALNDLFEKHGKSRIA